MIMLRGGKMLFYGTKLLKLVHMYILIFNK